jgi:hypothetical protein
MGLPGSQKELIHVQKLRAGRTDCHADAGHLCSPSPRDSYPVHDQCVRQVMAQSKAIFHAVTRQTIILLLDFPDLVAMNYVTSVHVTDRECLAPVPLRITRSTIPQIQAAKNASINLTPSTDRLTAFARDLSTRCDGNLHCKRSAAAPAMLVIPMILVLFDAVR